MNNNELLVQTARELAARLSNAEIDRASFRAQAIELQNENDRLKKQINDLQDELGKQKQAKEDQSEVAPKTVTDDQTANTSETEQDPQANK
ncbi:hypothetical protein [Limosilactobacillus reuteri]|uniref:Uncharacterized protein n=1 Tax=Limosilactobacillus reuteri TaxID=1598 RepID=A0A256VJK9_LIMRT|nr:hypothetical protein [Limosilactobacillus reuteri]OYS59375.1 hypothetical protein CBF91_09375 [Limosilactobacillus reuteri]OYS59548.1 hypothetical protein CBF88_06005 [Limosilactobacillus reuteri]OYS63117.1 hypothetical protein CBF89_09215 [Limosilactobacillus reuteri]OYS72401.1 hypothetical protein CBG01_05890 [Limosilactobacillus reuteri]OYS74581.1 hypothetical protein CBG07_09175 [Limosilactobacillus reuteri]